MQRVLMGIVLAVVLAGSPSAEACLNGTVVEQDEAVRLVKEAEQALEQGKYRRVMRKLDADHWLVDSNKLLRKIRELKAVAQLRLGRTKTAERMLRSLLRHDPKNPYLQTRLAEALAKRTGDDPVEAWRILDKLEKADLIPDAEGYAVLARLRHRAKDSEGRDRAIAQCRTMAVKPAALCRVPGVLSARR